MVFDDFAERPERADDGAVDVPHAPGGVTLDALPVCSVVHPALPRNGLHALAQMNDEPSLGQDALMRRGAPFEAAIHEGGERIGVVSVISQGLAKREEELLG